jgi:hypothetical protein
MEVRDGNRLVATIGLATASGVRSLTAAEAAIATHRKYWQWNGAVPRRVVVCGHLPSPAPTPPVSIVADVDEDDIVGAARPPTVVSAYDLRATPALLASLTG